MRMRNGILMINTVFRAGLLALSKVLHLHVFSLEITVENPRRNVYCFKSRNML